MSLSSRVEVELPDAVAVAAPAASEAASVPLRLDASTLRRALAAAPSSMERQAQAAGQTLRREPVSRDEKLASSLSAASKPGCLDPNGRGSLLSVFSIAIAYARDQCN